MKERIPWKADNTNFLKTHFGSSQEKQPSPSHLLWPASHSVPQCLPGLSDVRHEALDTTDSWGVDFWPERRHSTVQKGFTIAVLRSAWLKGPSVYHLMVEVEGRSGDPHLKVHLNSGLELPQADSTYVQEMMVQIWAGHPVRTGSEVRSTSSHNFPILVQPSELRTDCHRGRADRSKAKRPLTGCSQTPRCDWQSLVLIPWPRDSYRLRFWLAT